MGTKLHHPRANQHHSSAVTQQPSSTPGKATLTSAPRSQVTVAQNTGNGLYASPGNLWTPQQTSSPAERRVEQLIAILRRQLEQVQAQLDAKAAKLDPGLVDHMADVLEKERSELLTALTQLPTGAPLMMEGFAASDRVSEVLTRLYAVASAHHGQNSVNLPDVQGDDKALGFQAAETEVPAGYCDIAPQRQEPCDLDRTTRDRYRRRIAIVTAKARENWKNAIASARIEEKLKANVLTFEQQLGELLVGLLFNIFGNFVKGIAKQGLEKANRALTREVWQEDVGFVRQGMDPTNKALARGAIETAIDKGTPIAQTKLKAGITAQQLSQEARQPVPSDRTAFLDAMKTLPDRWHDTIIINLERLFDADLAALVAALPLESPSFSVDGFEQRISDVLRRFDEQVKPIGAVGMTHDRPVKVVTAHGVKLALVAPEQQRDKHMHGEWKWVEVNTGKFRFIRWIDDDMKEMALGRARKQDAYADLQMKAADDTTFWAPDSLRALAAQGAHTPQHDESRS